VLLPGAADGGDLCPVETPLANAPEQQLQRLDPHQRVAVLDARIVVGQHALRRVVVRQVDAKVDGFVDHHSAFGRVDHDRR
jgi:hypothetical protein